MKLPIKTETIQSVTTTDVVWEKLAKDPSISEIPSGSEFGKAPPVSRETYSAQQNQAEMIKSSGGALHGGSENLIATDDYFGHWINRRWRPLAAIVYLITCIFDFIVAPISWSILQSIADGQVTSQWGPLTLQGGALFHISFGAILGITAYGRTKEKISGKA
jgi:hypothetical protein